MSEIRDWVKNEARDNTGRWSDVASGDVAGAKAAKARGGAAKANAGEAPKFIARDEPGHKYQIVKRDPKIGSARADDIAKAFSKEDGKPFVLYQHSGTVADGSGRQLFNRTRFVADSNGGLHQYNSNGSTIGVHPPERSIRYLASSK
jgi:hypothetical protein